MKTLEKLTPGQAAAIRWLHESPGLALPSTAWRQEAWKAHSPASIRSFHSLQEHGLAFRKADSVRIDPDGILWFLTPEGEKLAARLLPPDRPLPSFQVECWGCGGHFALTEKDNCPNCGTRDQLHEEQDPDN